MYRSNHFESQNVGQSSVNFDASSLNDSPLNTKAANDRVVNSKPFGQMAVRTAPINSNNTTPLNSNNMAPFPPGPPAVPGARAIQGNEQFDGYSGEYQAQAVEQFVQSEIHPQPEVHTLNQSQSLGRMAQGQHALGQQSQGQLAQKQDPSQQQPKNSNLHYQDFAQNSSQVNSQVNANAAFQGQPPHLPATPIATRTKEQLGHELETRGVDLQISALFTAMGRASKLSRTQLAARLQTSVNLIVALETGTLESLPEWEEIAPVVVRYADFMNIDERPILRRLREQLTEHFLTMMTPEQENLIQIKKDYSQSSPNETPQSQTQIQTQTLGKIAPGSQLNAKSVDEAGSSILPSTDQTLRALACGMPLNAEDSRVNSSTSSLTPASDALEERFSALTSAVVQSQEASFSRGLHQQSTPANDLRGTQPQTNDAYASFDRASNPPDGLNKETRYVQQAVMADQTKYRSPQATPSHQMHVNTPRNVDTDLRHRGEHRYQQGRGMEAAPLRDGNLPQKSRVKWLRVCGNVAFVIILLVGFINWQPNRFWSGVDQLPKPISNSIYKLFEIVMPDPLASVYRMNWVYVEDPRMRKADKLSVPAVRKLPALDFSKLGRISP